MRATLAALALFLIASCAESASEATAIVGPDDVVIDREFVDAAHAALATAQPSEEGWLVGIISGEREDPWALAVLTLDGGITFDYSWKCNDNLQDAKDFLVLTDPGDLIEWSTKGDDNRVCSNEIRLIEKAAAL